MSHDLCAGGQVINVSDASFLFLMELAVECGWKPSGEIFKNLMVFEVDGIENQLAVTNHKAKLVTANNVYIDEVFNLSTPVFRIHEVPAEKIAETFGEEGEKKGNANWVTMNDVIDGARGTDFVPEEIRNAIIARFKKLTEFFTDRYRPIWSVVGPYVLNLSVNYQAAPPPVGTPPGIHFKHYAYLWLDEDVAALVKVLKETVIPKVSEVDLLGETGKNIRFSPLAIQERENEKAKLGIEPPAPGSAGFDDLYITGRGNASVRLGDLRDSNVTAWEWFSGEQGKNELKELAEVLAGQGPLFAW